MDFMVLDIEDEGAVKKLRGQFDLLIASNCVHATRNLVGSLRNLRGLLGAGGALVMIETTSGLT